jgi:hypothetical protein
MEKRMFQILDEMNVNDINNGTATLGVCYDFISASKVKAGGHVTIGVPENIIMDMIFEKNRIPILLIVDKAEYDKVKNNLPGL